jgi:hypothetical protein
MFPILIVGVALVTAVRVLIVWVYAHTGMCCWLSSCTPARPAHW